VSGLLRTLVLAWPFDWGRTTPSSPRGGSRKLIAACTVAASEVHPRLFSRQRTRGGVGAGHSSGGRIRVRRTGESVVRPAQERRWPDVARRMGTARIGSGGRADSARLPRSIAIPAKERKNLHRTDYPSCLANGWQIGSGPIEAACKTVIGQRLRCSGMRRGDDGAKSIAHPRALYLSESAFWEAFWRQSPN
jgi:hypothetical protein